jgi:O-antigen biosynthesis protein
MVKSGKSICLATNDFKGFVQVGGIGSYFDQLAKLLKKNGWAVSVLVHRPQPNFAMIAEQYYAENAIRIYDAEKLYMETGKSLDDIKKSSFTAQITSHIIHEALQVLKNKYHQEFDLIEFPEWRGPGFIAIRENLNSGTYSNSQLIVKLHSPTEWHRQSSRQEFTSLNRLALNYMEKYAFENADVRISPTQFLLRWAKEQDWKINGAEICRNPIEKIVQAGSQRGNTIAKLHSIVFFGRFDIRKGVDDFIQALQYIKRTNPHYLEHHKVVFLGSPSEYSEIDIKSAMEGISVEILFFPREQAINYLQKNARLVVIPSRMDNYPNTVLECMAAGIPFITSRSGGIPEILGAESELYHAVSCDTTDAKTFAETILGYLNYDIEKLGRWLNLADQRIGIISDNQQIAAWYDHLVEKPAHSQGAVFKHSAITGQETSVTVLIPYYNMHQYVEATLKSLKNQTYQKFDIILVNDGSTDPASIQMLENIQKNYPSIKILNKSNGGIGAARNFALNQHINSKYLVAVDADNIASPEMLENFVHSIENRPGIVALSCYNAHFRNEDEPAVLKSLLGPGEFSASVYYKPLGPCLPNLFFQNVQGDTNSIYLVEAIKAVGGWSEKRQGHQDWALWLNLVAHGYEIDVIPRILFYYRVHPGMETWKQKIIDADETNFEYLRSFIEKNPENFYKAYTAVHRLVRASNRSKPMEPTLVQPGAGFVKRAIRYYKSHGALATLKESIARMVR